MSEVTNHYPKVNISIKSALLKSRFYVVALVIFVACTNLPQTSQEVAEQVKTYVLSYDTISNYPHKLQGNVFLKDNSLIMIDPMNARELYTLDTQTAESNHYSMSDSLKGLNSSLFPFSYYHSSMRYHYRYHLENGRLKLSLQNFRLLGKTVNRVVQLNEKKFAFTGFLPKGLLGTYDKETGETRYFGRYPVSVYIPPERKAAEKILQSFQGELIYDTPHSKVIYCSNNFAYMACYIFTGRKFKLAWEHHVIPPPAVKVYKGFIKTDNDAPCGGFSSVTTSGDYIFAVYRQGKSSDNLSDYTHHILVYNMNGLHVATFDIDCPLSTISVDMEKKTIYGVSYVVDPVILRFNFENLHLF